jgi:glycosyltransferase involved in cell wall biosynthesis
MRVLWFSVTPSMFNPCSNSHNGGGWIASLEKIVRTEALVELGVAFEFMDRNFKYESKGVYYYPISSKKLSIYDKLRGRTNVEDKLAKCLRIIDDFKPDLIQIFGSENDFGLICEHTEVPVIIHIQGCLPPYHNALFPVGINKYDFYFARRLTWRYRWIGLRSEPAFRKQAEQEIRIIQSCQYFMGRTEWDKGLADLFNPRAKYFHCDEALRDVFLQNTKVWGDRESPEIRIISVISNPWYKGVDLILKTAQLLKRFVKLDFEWQVYGVQNENVAFYENKYDIRANNVNVKIMGAVSKDKLVDVLCNATCFVHPSYIDNSPNSVCEAQILGLPVLATHVGGISSIVKDGETGILFPANDPYTLASKIKEVTQSPELAVRLGKVAREQALKRHDPMMIRMTLMNIYKQILENG